MYRLGYRGDMVGYKWEGDENTPLFDFNEENAFQSSFGLMSLIKSLNDSNKQVYVAAHSLGNLVVLDALRRLALTYPGKSFVKNLVHIEAAVWETIYANNPADLIQREIHQRAEWTSWASEAHSTVSGTIVNSFNPNDGALYAMLANDTVSLTKIQYEGPTLFSPYFTYNSWALAQNGFRTPNKLSYNIPRNPNELAQINVFPLGMVELTEGAFSNRISFNANAVFGWDATSHSNYRDRPLQRIWLWYLTVLNGFTE